MTIFLMGTEYSHRYWGYASLILMICLKRTEYPHRYCISQIFPQALDILGGGGGQVQGKLIDEGAHRGDKNIMKGISGFLVNRFPVINKKFYCVVMICATTEKI